MTPNDVRQRGTRFTAVALSLVLLGGFAAVEGAAPPAPAEAADPITPKDYYSDQSGATAVPSISGVNPCVSIMAKRGDAPMSADQQRRFDEINCSVVPLSNFAMPAALIPEQKISTVVSNCQPTPIARETSVSDVVYVDNATSSSFSRSLGVSLGASTTSTVRTAPGGVGWEQSVTYSVEVSTGVTFAEGSSRAVQTGKWTNSNAPDVVPPYSWHYFGYKDLYSQTDLLWRWTDGDTVRSAIQTINIHQFREGKPIATENPAFGTFGTPVSHVVPMTPAEIKKCWDDGKPQNWKAGDPYLSYRANASNLTPPIVDEPDLRAPRGDLELDSYPYLYVNYPDGNPVTRNMNVAEILPGKDGTPASLLSLKFTSNEVEMWGRESGSSRLTDLTTENSIVMPPGSEVAFWTGGVCKSVTATLGGSATVNRSYEMRIKVSAVTMKNGVATLTQELGDFLAPNAGNSASERADGKLRIDDIPDGTDAIAFTAYRPDGASDKLAKSWVFGGGRAAIVVADPVMKCATPGETPGDKYIRSAYIGEIRNVTANLAATTAQVQADPYLNLRPNAAPTPGDKCNDRPDYVGYSCHGTTTAVADVGYPASIGLVANTSVQWGLTPPTCTMLRFGAGWDDSVIAHDKITGSIHRSPIKISIYVDEKLHKAVYMTPRMTGTLYPVELALPLGPHHIRLDVDAQGSNSWAYVNIVEPRLDCQLQDGKTGAVRPAANTATMDFLDVGTLPWSNLESWTQWDALPNKNPVTGGVLSIGGFTYPKGVGAHSYNSFDVTIPRTDCRVFTADVGVLTSGIHGTVQFEVWNGDKIIAQSRIMKGGQPPSILTADVTGLKKITLKVINGGDNANWDHAGWGSPVIGCTGTKKAPRPVEPTPGPTSTPSPTATAAPDETISAAEVPWAQNINPYKAATPGLNVDSGKVVSIADRTFKTAIWEVSGGSVRISTNGECVAFNAIVGVDDFARQHGAGSLRFELVGDGKPITESPTMYGNGKTHAFSNVNISGVDSLELKVTDNGDGINWDHGVWGDPELTCVAGAAILTSKKEETTKYLSDSRWREWPWSDFEPKRNTNLLGTGPVAIGGTEYKRGIAAHSDTIIRVPLNGNCRWFSADVGIDDTAGDRGRATFEVWTDSKLVYSTTRTGDQPSWAIGMDISGTSELTLTVLSDGSHEWDHASWGDPKVTCRQ